MIRETLRMRWLALPLALLMPFGAAHAQIALSDLVVELHPGKDSRQDVEVANNGSDRAFVAIEPAEIVNPGTSAETRRSDPDPEKLGLLVSPSRMILEAGQRKLIRFADIEPASDRERVYRVTVKPVVGEIAKEQSGLKLLIGYDVLVLARPRSRTRTSSSRARPTGASSATTEMSASSSPAGGNATRAGNPVRSFPASVSTPGRNGA